MNKDNLTQAQPLKKFTIRDVDTVKTTAAFSRSSCAPSGRPSRPDPEVVRLGAGARGHRSPGSGLQPITPPS